MFPVSLGESRTTDCIEDILYLPLSLSLTLSLSLPLSPSLPLSLSLIYSVYYNLWCFLFTIHVIEPNVSLDSAIIDAERNKEPLIVAEQL